MCRHPKRRTPLGRAPGWGSSKHPPYLPETHRRPFWGCPRHVIRHIAGASASARLEECEAINGAADVSSASLKVLSDTCEISTIIPRWSSRTTCRPKSKRPCGSAEGSAYRPRECGLCVSRSESDTQLKIGSQHGQIGVDHVPALHAHQDGDCPKPAG
jgi:hypothetical protein